MRLDKAGSSGGPAAEKFNDNSWRSIDLPHDWAIELPFDRASDESHGFKPVGPGFYKNSIGWYRRTFDLPAADSGKRIWLTFDGVFRDATVWVNDWLVTRHEGGYYPFREDVTDIVRFGGKNVVTVKVDASKFEGWFYEGAGIYRHVWLDKTAPVAIAPDGVFVHTEFNDNVPEGPASICIETRILNPPTNSRAIKISHKLIAPNGIALAETFPSFEPLPPPSLSAKQVSKPQEDYRNMIVLRPKLHFEHVPGIPAQPFRMPSYQMPKMDFIGGFSPPMETQTDIEFWSPESPKLYKLITTVSVDDKIVDRKETKDFC